MKLYYPVRNPVGWNQRFGNFPFTAKRSYFEFSPITIPLWENSQNGISSVFTSLLSTKQKQRNQSTFLNLFLLKTHTPFCSRLTGFPLFSFLLYRFADFTSTSFSPHCRSAPDRLKTRCSAPSRLLAYFSQIKPFPVQLFQNTSESLRNDSGCFISYHERFEHFIEQNFGRPFAFSSPQNKHLFILKA